MGTDEQASAAPPQIDGEVTVATLSPGSRDRHALEVGARIDRYVVLERIAEGGMGVVYTAYDPRLDRKVALKLLKLADDGGTRPGRAALAREAQSMARLSHPHVVAVHDAGVYEAAQGEALYLAMDFVEGRSLRRVLADIHADPRFRKRGATRAIVALFVAAGRGLQAAHEAEIIHRDFKPHNVLVGDDGTVRVADFGLAHSLGARGSMQALVDGDPFDAQRDESSPTPVGTPAYMSPQQLAGEPVDARADQYSFCIALYEALYGERPFEGATIGALLYQTTHGEVRRPPTAPKVPRRMRRILLRGLEADPDRRYPSMAALLDDLAHDPRAILRALAPVAGLGALLVAGGWATWTATRPGSVEVDVASAIGIPTGIVVRVGEHPLELVGTTARGDVSAGLQELRVSADGHEPHRGLVDVPRGGAVVVDVVLEQSEGTVDLEVDPIGARILIDGRDYGARLTNTRIATGDHHVEIQRVGHYDATFEWHIERNATHTRYVSLASAMTWSAPLTGINAQTGWIGDVTGDGRLDVIHRNFNSYYVFDPWEGEAVARHRFPETGAWAASVADLDGDGVVELIASGENASSGEVAVRRVIAGSTDAPPVWRFVGAKGLVRLRHRALPVTVDRTGSRWRDLAVVSPWARTVLVLDGRSGKVRWQAPLASEATAVVIATGPDGEARVVVATETGVEVFAVSNGAPRFSVELPLVPPDRDDVIEELQSVLIFGDRPRLVLAELDGAPGDDILTVGDVARPIATRAHAIASDGRVLWSGPADFTADLRGTRRVDDDASEDLLGLVPDGVRPQTAVVSGVDGALLWTAPGDRNRWIDWPDASLPQVASIDDRRLSVRRASDGHEIAAIDLPARMTALPTTVDLDRDGRRELLVPLDDATIAMYTTADAAPARIRLPVAVTRMTEAIDANTDGFPDLVFDDNGPAVVTGPKTCWRRAARDAVRAAPVVVDADDDGDLDVVAIGPFDEGDSAVHVFDGRTGQRIARSDDADGSLGSIRTPALLPAADSSVGVLLADFTRNRIGLWSTRDGSLLADAPAPHVYATPGIWPMPGGGPPAIVVVPWDRGPLRVLDGRTWTEEWHTDAGAGSWAQPRALDVDRDGIAELLVADHEGRVRLYDLGVARPRWDVDLGAGKFNAVPVPGDTDADGDLELLTSTTDRTSDLVLLRAGDGRELLRWPGLGSATAAGTLVDIDRDGRDEIFAAGAATIHRIRGDDVAWSYHAGANPWGEDIQPKGPIVVADLDGDGARDLIATFTDGSLRVLDAATGTFRWRFDTDSEAIEGGATVADVDDDGIAEVLIGSHSRHLYCLRSPRSGVFVPESD